MIKVNGSELSGKEGMTVSELVAEMGFRAMLIAVEVNGTIVKKSDYESKKLSDGDKIEVVSFVGGG